MSVYRATSSEAEQIEQTRKLIEKSRDVLKRSVPDTFAGRNTSEPPPTDAEVLERWINLPGLKPPQ